MKRKGVITVMALALLIPLTACGGAKNETTKIAATESKSEIVVTNTPSPTPTLEPVETEEPTPKPTDEPKVVIDTSWYADNGDVICEGLYFVGGDILPENYIFTGLGSKYGSVRVSVFEDLTAYQSYYRTNRFTIGEEGDAVEANAKSSEYVRDKDSCALNLVAGNVLTIKGQGYGELVSSDADDNREKVGTTIGSKKKLADGAYGMNDITRASYMLTCTKPEYSQLRVIIFESMDSYGAYSKTVRSTNGEEREAEEQNAVANYYLEQGETCYINVTGDYVVLIDGGTAQLEPVTMSWSNRN